MSRDFNVFAFINKRFWTIYCVFRVYQRRKYISEGIFAKYFVNLCIDVPILDRIDLKGSSSRKLSSDILCNFVIP